MGAEGAGELRLLPWVGDGGKDCYLVSGSEGGVVSRLADATETIRLEMGSELLAHAREMLTEDASCCSGNELRFLAARLSEALGDALRVAESRGRRLG